MFHVGKVLWIDKVLVTDKPTDKHTDESETNVSRHEDVGSSSELNGSAPSHKLNSLTCVNDSDVVFTDCKSLSGTSETSSLSLSENLKTVDKSKQSKTVLKPVILQEEPFEWQRTHIGHKLIADHWPHEYQKTLKLFLQSETTSSFHNI